MEKSNQTELAKTPGDYTLGTMLGRRQAFGTVAGRTAAAEAECLRRLRDDRLYKNRAATWDEFCEKELGMSRSNADRVIRLLEEFGPAYFEVSQFTRITPEAYRAIAGAVRDQAIHVNGESIALIAENAGKVQAAVKELRQNLVPKPLIPLDPRLAPPAGERDVVLPLERRCQEVLAEFARLIPVVQDDIIDRRDLESLIIMMRFRLGQMEAQVAG